MKAHKLKNEIRELLLFVWKIDKTVVCTIIVSFLIEAALPFAGIYLSAYVLDGLKEGRDAGRMICVVALVMGGIFLFTALKSLLQNIFEVHAEICVRKFEMEMSGRTLEMDYELLDSPKVNEIRTRIRNDANWGSGLWSVLTYGCAIVQNVWGTVIAAGILLSLFAGWGVVWEASTFLMLGGGAAVMAASAWFSEKKQKEMYGLLDESSYTYGFLDYFLYGNQDYRQGKDIRVYKGQKIIEHYMEKGQEKKDIWTGRASAVACRQGFAKGASAGILRGLAYLFVTVQAVRGGLSIGSVMKYAATIYCFSQAFQGVLTSITDYVLAVGRLQSTIEYMHVPDVLYKGSLPVEKRFFCEGGDNDYEIEFRNVSFCYPSSTQYVLKDFCFQFRTGERLAVVGKNGSGKTTFIKLLCRLYDPTEGEILLNGVNIKKYDQEEYRRIFSVVFQDFKIFSFSIAQNVASSVDYDKEKVISCLKRAGFGERLSGLPCGEETLLYKNFDEDGLEISGGEAQKLALARALYKDAPFMILDEPTAALDPIAEYDIYRRFNEIVGGKTAIYISHRLSSCRFCDDIAVFDEGRLVQRGSHEELVADQAGTYYELWNAQAKYYKSEGE